MLRAADTTFLVQLELKETAGHDAALRYLEQKVIAQGHTLGITLQVIEEFIHVATDPHRFERPLTMTEALDRCDLWWRASEVQQVFPSPEAVELFIEWMRGLRLGRRRVHDTFLAATCVSAGITHLITSDREGFAVFGGLTIVDPLSA